MHEIYSWSPQEESYWNLHAYTWQAKFSMQSARRCIVLAYLRELRDAETEHGSGSSAALLKTGLSRCATCLQGDLVIWFKQPPRLSLAAEGVYDCGSTVSICIVWCHSNTGAAPELLWLTGRNLRCERSSWISSSSWQLPRDTTEWNENWNLFSLFSVLCLVQC